MRAEQKLLCCAAFNDGSLTGKDFELVSEPIESDAEATAYMRQYYSSRGIMPKNILLREMPEDAEALSVLFNQLCGRKVSIEVPQRGERLRLVERALR